MAAGGSWGEDWVDPSEEDLGVDAGFEETDGDELETQEGTDDVGAPLGVPVPTSVAAPPHGRVTEGEALSWANPLLSIQTSIRPAASYAARRA